jgi:lipoate-protein ligase A
MSASSGSMSDTWRLLNDPPAGGAWNMAVDEVLLDGVATGAVPPTLRFYRWTPACLSLGYFQPLDVVNLDGCRELGVEIVRRPTGGRAILHDRELTYSITLPASVLGPDGGVLPSYYRLSLALQDGLRQLGVAATLAPESAASSSPEHGPICFDRPSAHEILLDGRKLVGSAQMRRGGGLLQHGSILIEPRLHKLRACLRLAEESTDSSAGGGFERIEDGVAGLAEAGVSDPAQIADAMASAFAARFGVALVEGRLGGDELATAQALAASKYQSAGWTERLEPALGRNTTRTR